MRSHQTIHYEFANLPIPIRMGNMLHRIEPSLSRLDLVVPTNSSDTYRYGFNGKENDNELKGAGNSLDFGGRIFDSRLGRWLSLDPLMEKYPGFSPYNFCANNPIMFIDPSGKIIVPAWKEEVRVLKSMIKNYFKDSNCGFVVKKDKIHFNEKKFNKFIATCTDPVVIENTYRLKEIVTNENKTTLFKIATSHSLIREVDTGIPVSSSYSTYHIPSILGTGPGYDITVPSVGATVIRTKTIKDLSGPNSANLKPDEPGAFIYSVINKTLLSAVLVNPVQGREFDTQPIDNNNTKPEFGQDAPNVVAKSTLEGAAFHELIGHTYDAYMGNFSKPTGSATDSGTKQENDYNSKIGAPLRTGKEH